MILFFVQCCFCHEHWEVDILYANLLEKLISEPLNLLPDVVRGGTQDVTSRDIVILNQFRLCDYLRVPLAKVLLLCIFDTSLVSFSIGLGLRGCFRLLLLLLLFTLLLLLLFLWLLSTFFLLPSSCGLGATLTSGSSSSGRCQCCKVYDLGLVAAELDELHHAFFSNGRCSSVNHRMETNIRKVFREPLVNYKLNCILRIIND